MTDNRPADITLPEGWTWERVEAERARWSIDDTMVPIAVVPGACVGWGTINSVRQSRKPLAPTVVDVSTIHEYGLEQKLSNSIRCF